MGGFLDLINSAVAYPLATSLLAAQEMTFALTRRLGCCNGTRPAQARLYNATEKTLEQFGDILTAMFEVGDSVQHILVDLAYDVASGKALQPVWVQDAAHAVLHQSYETLQAITNPRLVWLEMQNKYQVYNLVKNVETTDIPDVGAGFPLLEIVNESYQAPVYERLWKIEGLGNRYGLYALDHPPVKGILTKGIAELLPTKSLLMLHAGIGLAFATVCLKDLNPYGSQAAIKTKVDVFIDLCAANGRPGYLGACHESLGLVVRTFYPDAKQVVDEHLRSHHPDVCPYFWHGFGRGLYFYPSYFVPGGISPWQTAERETPDDFAYWNAAAGLSWAFALVNIRQPEILANLLSSPDWVLPPRPALFNGMLSSFIMARNVAPDEEYIYDICEYTSPDMSPQALKNWQDIVHPIFVDLDHFSQVLKEHDRLGDIFRYQDLQALVTQLERQGSSGNA